MIFYISDLHLNDNKIIKLCKRPFKNSNDYYEKMKNSWNNKVKKNDVVYIVGDIFGINKHITKSVLKQIKQLNGKKHLIIGNHDEFILSTLIKHKIFLSTNHIITINDNKRTICLCHYPIMDWNDYNYGSYHIYGHIHNKTYKNCKCYEEIKNYFKNKNAYNASADVIGFIPRTLDELIKLKRRGK